MSEQTKWEYKLVSVPLYRLVGTARKEDEGRPYEELYEFKNDDPGQALMNRLGDAGWHLHSVVQGGENSTVLVFKRAKGQ